MTSVAIRRRFPIRTKIGKLVRRLLGQLTVPAVGQVHLGDLNRTAPISRSFGYDRGLPIDRYYIENFLCEHRNDIQGRVLEIGDATYTHRFGGDSVSASEVLHISHGNPSATVVGDLSSAEHLPSDHFDCLIITQTLHLIYDTRSAIKTIYRILKPGGVALLTVPGISQKSNDQWAPYWCWAFTSYSAKRLMEESFPSGSVEVQAFGNILSAIAFLEGMATEELTQKQLDVSDPSYELLITLRGAKPFSPEN